MVCTRAVHARQIRSVARMNVISRQTVCTSTVIMTAIVLKMRVVATMNAEILPTADTLVIPTLIVARPVLAVMEHVRPIVIPIHIIGFSPLFSQFLSLSSSLFVYALAGLIFVLGARVRASRKGGITALFRNNRDVLEDSVTSRVQILTLIGIENTII